MVIVLWRKVKQRRGLGSARVGGKFTVLNRVAKEVVTQKVEFTQTAKIGKKTSIYMSM